VNAVGFDMDMCYTPHYDTAGWIFLGCVGYGGGMVNLDPVGPEDSEGAGFGRVSVELQTEYNFSEYVHLGLRAGAESYLLGDGSELSRRVLTGNGTNIAPFVTLGVGFHF
jgi:hypothetical protein